MQLWPSYQVIYHGSFLLNCYYGLVPFFWVQLSNSVSFYADSFSTILLNPRSISWEYVVLDGIDVDDYEKFRPPRRLQQEMILSRTAREEALRFEWNASRKEIIESVRRNVRVKNQRRTTVNNLGKATKFEEAMESASRKFKRLVKGQKSVRRQVRDLEEEFDLTNRRRSKLLYLEQSMSHAGEETAPTAKASVVLSDSGNGSVSSSND